MRRKVAAVIIRAGNVLLVSTTRQSAIESNWKSLGIKIGSVFSEEVLPWLVEKNFLKSSWNIK